jgi:hypothetical protein
MLQNVQLNIKQELAYDDVFINVDRFFDNFVMFLLIYNLNLDLFLIRLSSKKSLSKTQLLDIISIVNVEFNNRIYFVSFVFNAIKEQTDQFMSFDLIYSSMKKSKTIDFLVILDDSYATDYELASFKVRKKLQDVLTEKMPEITFVFHRF